MLRLGLLGLPTLGIAAMLNGCGFQPVYRSSAGGKPGPAERNLPTIFVNIIPDRPGQLLRQALQARLDTDPGVPERYRLAVGYSIAGEGIGIITGDIATRIRLTGRANWTLTTNDTVPTKVASGAARAMDGFNNLDEQYFASDLDTEAVDRRLAQHIADQIVMQLAVYFRRQAAIAAR